jgi:ribosome modulation factor
MRKTYRAKVERMLQEGNATVRRISLDDSTTYLEVRAWVRGAKKDSAVLRQYTGDIACGDCIAKLRSGVSPHAQDFETALDAPAAPAPVQHDGAIFTDTSTAYRTGFADGYAGRPSEPEKYILVSREEYRNGWVDGRNEADMDHIRKELGVSE